MRCQVPMALCVECTHSDNASIVCGILANVTPRYQDEKGCLYGSNLTCPNKCPTPSMIFHWALQTSLEEWSINLGIGNQFWNWFGIKLIGNQSGHQIYRMAGFKNEPEHSSRCPLPPHWPPSHFGWLFPTNSTLIFPEWGGRNHSPQSLFSDLNVHVCCLVKSVSEKEWKKKVWNEASKRINPLDLDLCVCKMQTLHLQHLIWKCLIPVSFFIIWYSWNQLQGNFSMVWYNLDQLQR